MPAFLPKSAGNEYDCDVRIRNNVQGVRCDYKINGSVNVLTLMMSLKETRPREEIRLAEYIGVCVGDSF